MSECLVVTLKKEEWQKICTGKIKGVIRKTSPSSITYPFKAFVYVKEDKEIQGFVIIKNCITSFPSRDIDKISNISVKEQESCANGEKISCWEIQNWTKYKSPETLDNFGLTRAPGQWKYIKNNKKENTRKVFSAYTDGSYNKKTEVYGFAVVILDNDGKEHRFQGSGEEHKKYWNVAGELEAAMLAVRKAKEMGCTELHIYHDYEGVAYWPKGIWRAKNEFTEQYSMFMNKSELKIIYHHVKAHTGDKYNEIVDTLSTEAAGIHVLDSGDAATEKYIIDDCSIEEEAKNKGTTKECIQNLRAFKRKEKRVFKDYAMLKTGGTDSLSKKHFKELMSICSEKEQKYFEAIFANEDFNEKEQSQVLRWYHRGLSGRDSVKKVQIDKEISENIQKRKR